MVFNLYKSANVVKSFVECLTASETRTVEVALECLYKVLTQGQKAKGRGLNLLLLDLQEFIGILESLQSNASEVFYLKVEKIISEFLLLRIP